MVASVQTFVQRRYYGLLMSILGLDFVMLFFELLGYRHWQGLQIIGLATVVLGAIASFVAIGANASLRKGLAVLFLVLSLAGIIGVWEHNEERLGGAGERRPPVAAQQNRQVGQRPPEGDFHIPPPTLAPLSLSGFCILGAVVLFGRRDD